MSTVYKNKGRKDGKQNITSVTKSQKSGCIAAFYRWDEFDKTKLMNVSVETEGSLGIDAGGSPATGNIKEKKRVVVDNDIVRCSVTKNKGSSSGQFSITLKQGFKEDSKGIIIDEKINYLNVLHPGDWVWIYMRKETPENKIEAGDSSADSGLKMIGIIDNVRYIEADDPTTGKPRLEYIVTGRDFGRILDQSTFFNPVLNNKTISSVLGAFFMADALESIKGSESGDVDLLATPDDNIKHILSFYLGGLLSEKNRTNQPWYIPTTMARNLGISKKAKSQGVSFVDILNLDKIGLHQHSNFKFTGVKPLLGKMFIKSLPATGTLWSIIQFLQNQLLNEAFTDLSLKDNKLKPTITVRQMPFSNRKGSSINSTNIFDLDDSKAVKDTVNNDQKTFLIDLPRLNIKSTDIKQKNVGKSNFERINHLMVVPRVDDDNTKELFTSSLNIPSIQRYGLKTFQGQTSYTLDPNLNTVQYTKACISLLQDWLFSSHALYNGTIVTDGIDEHVELGTNIYITDVEQLFHIEGYTHTYQIVSATGQINFDTEFRVSRGQTVKGRSASFIDSPKNRRDSTTIAVTGIENVRNKK